MLGFVYDQQAPGSLEALDQLPPQPRGPYGDAPQVGGFGDFFKGRVNARRVRGHGGNPYVRVPALILFTGAGLAKAGPAVNDRQVPRLLGEVQGVHYFFGRWCGRPFGHAGRCADSLLAPLARSQPAGKLPLNFAVVALVFSTQPGREGRGGDAGLPGGKALLHLAPFDHAHHAGAEG